MNNNIYLGRILGIPFRLHWSWFLAVALIMWTLAESFFPVTLPQYAGEPGVYWALGLLAALGLFASVVLHEIGHALVATHYGISVRGIRLFVFGGVAELGSDAKKPSHEILIAVAGPAVTVLLIVLFNLGLAAVVSAGGLGYGMEGGTLRIHGGSLLTAGIASLLFYLAFVNLMLLLFNVIPAFPLDGGRVLRGIIWAMNGNYLTSTRIAGGVGIVFAYFLFIAGLFISIKSSLFGGLWLVFLGMFLLNAAHSSIAYAQLQMLLNGITVKDVMNESPITVDAQMPLREVVDHYFLKRPHKAYPVVEDGKFIGMLTLPAVQDVARDRWDWMRAGELVRQLEPVPSLQPHDQALRALRTFGESGASRLPVVENGNLLGLLCLRDLMSYVHIHAGLDVTGSRLWPTKRQDK